MSAAEDGSATARGSSAAASAGMAAGAAAGREATPPPRERNPMAELATTYSELRGGEHTLACLLQGMLGVRTTVELNSDTEVTGTLRSVDAHMNIAMSDVTLSAPLRAPVSLEAFYAAGRFVRYVHIPVEVPVERTIKKRIEDTRAATRRSRGPRPGKRKAAP